MGVRPPSDWHQRGPRAWGCGGKFHPGKCCLKHLGTTEPWQRSALARSIKVISIKVIDFKCLGSTNRAGFARHLCFWIVDPSFQRQHDPPASDAFTLHLLKGYSLATVRCARNLPGHLKALPTALFRNLTGAGHKGMG